jgi:acetylornithine/N-succinyldiaminopimelate aminotransferase
VLSEELKIKNKLMKTFDVYPLFDIEPVKGEGCYLWDKNGKRYLDLYGGHAVISIGHSHPHYVKRLNEQLSKIGFYSNSVIIQLQEELAEKFGKLSGYEDYHLFLCNSGAEANENALKLASFQNGRKKIIAFDKSFHGRTSLAVAATDDQALSAPVNKNDSIIFLPLNDEGAIEENITEEICAVIIEGIQGAGGIRVPTEFFLKKLRRLCTATGCVLILDEVQSGYGRTGQFFAHQQAEIRPDLITVAKGMGNGFPVGGVLISPKFKARHGMLGTTFGGNHLACAAALAVLEIIEEENLVQNATKIGQHLKENLPGMDGITEVRGRGLMLGISFDFPASTVRNALLNEHRIFTGSSSDKNTLRILPPLILKKEEADIFLNAINQVLEEK